MASVSIDRRVERVAVRMVDRYVQALAKAGKEHGQEISPTGPTGRYRKSWRVVKVQDGWWQIRQVDFAAHIVEWGSENNPAYRPMGSVQTWLNFNGPGLLDG